MDGEAEEKEEEVDRYLSRWPRVTYGEWSQKVKWKCMTVLITQSKLKKAKLKKAVLWGLETEAALKLYLFPLLCMFFLHWDAATLNLLSWWQWMAEQEFAGKHVYAEGHSKNCNSIVEKEHVLQYPVVQTVKPAVEKTPMTIQW